MKLLHALNFSQYVPFMNEQERRAFASGELVEAERLKAWRAALQERNAAIDELFARSYARAIKK